MNLYEEVMPKYLAMSRAELIAEILEKGQPMHDWLQKQSDGEEVEPEGFEGMMGMTVNLSNPPDAIDRASREAGYANEVLRNRFGLTVEFHYGMQI